MNYFICGFSGAGKSYLLKELSEERILSQFEFLDLDDYIFRKVSGYDCLGDYIRAVGLAKFRLDEFEALKELASKDKVFISLGGGSLTEKTMPLLQGLASISGFWLNTDFDLCYERIKDDRNRPLSTETKEELKRMYLEREVHYKEFPAVQNACQVIEIISV